jgi:hypothetical protein
VPYGRLGDPSHAEHRSTEQKTPTIHWKFRHLAPELFGAVSRFE